MARRGRRSSWPRTPSAPRRSATTSFRWPMGALVKALVLRPIVREKTRTLLTLLGIAVGVAVVVAIALSNQSALRAFRESVDAVAGRANWQIAADSDLDEDVLLRLQPLWARGVRFAPVIDVNGVAEPAQTPIRVLAVDLLSDLHCRDYRYARVVTDRVIPSAARNPQPQGVPRSARDGTANDPATYLRLFEPH